MYIPKINLETNQEEIVAFMNKFSFATIITSLDNFPIATHLPFIITQNQDKIILKSHFAKANEHWKSIENTSVLVIFNEPHAYISPKHYEKELEVPTWNYISVHAYGKGKLMTETDQKLQLLEATINTFEKAYKTQWDKLPDDFKLRNLNGIVAFEVEISDLQAKKKLSQNKTQVEQNRIIDSLSKSSNSNEQLIAQYMKDNQQ